MQAATQRNAERWALLFDTWRSTGQLVADVNERWFRETNEMREEMERAQQRANEHPSEAPNALMESSRSMQRRTASLAFDSSARAGEAWREASVRAQRLAELNFDAFWDWATAGGAAPVNGRSPLDWTQVWGEAWADTSRRASAAVTQSYRPPPPQSASKSEWVDYAVSQGSDPSEAEDTTKAELIERYSA